MINRESKLLHKYIGITDFFAFSGLDIPKDKLISVTSGVAFPENIIKANVRI